MDKLSFISQQMSALGIPYEFMEWTAEKIPDRYFIGEYTETPPMYENGLEESTITLIGTTRENWIVLEQDKEKIKKHFPPVGGLCAKTDGGRIAAFYAGSFPVPTGEMDLKRIQINIEIKEWKV